MLQGRSISLYALKPQFQSLLRPAVHRLHRNGISANQITVAACVLSLAVGAWVCTHASERGWFLLIPLWFVLRMALNAIDGMLARECGDASVLGAYLNETTDVVSDAALYVPFAFVAAADAAWIAAVVFLAALVEFVGVLGATVGAGRRYDGPMGKSDRALTFGAVGLALGAGAEPGPWCTAVYGLVAVLSIVTIINRVRAGVAVHRTPSR